MKRLFVAMFVFGIVCVSTNASYCAEYWAKTYKENIRSGAKVIQQTSDGGYIMGGGTSIDTSNSDFWLVKLDVKGDITL